MAPRTLFVLQYETQGGPIEFHGPFDLPEEAEVYAEALGGPIRAGDEAAVKWCASVYPMKEPVGLFTLAGSLKITEVGIAAPTEGPFSQPGTLIRVAFPRPVTYSALADTKRAMAHAVKTTAPRCAFGGCVPCEHLSVIYAGMRAAELSILRLCGRAPQPPKWAPRGDHGDQ